MDLSYLTIFTILNATGVRFIWCVNNERRLHWPEFRSSIQSGKNEFNGRLGELDYLCVDMSRLQSSVLCLILLLNNTSAYC